MSDPWLYDFSGQRILDPDYNFVPSTYFEAADKDYKLIKEIQIGWITLAITVFLIVCAALFQMASNGTIIVALALLIILFSVIGMYIRGYTRDSVI